jgi:hypothetical protein
MPNDFGLLLDQLIAWTLIATILIIFLRGL